MKFSFSDLFFPKYCSGCSRLGTYVCLKCQKEIILLPDICIKCAKPSYFGVTHNGCNSTVDTLAGLIVYRGFSAKVIKDGKYRLASAVLEEFLTVLEPLLFEKLQKLKRLYPEFLLQPVPLHPKRYKERGFNQAEIIAKRIEKLTGMPRVNVAVRAKHNAPQAQLAHRGEARHENVKGIFEVKKDADIAGKDVVLVDDVVTSGSTVEEAARALKLAGARRVAVVALAKG